MGMNRTDSDRQTVFGIEPCRSQRIDPSWCNATNIIPFPDARASRQRPERTKSSVLSLSLRRAARRVKEAMLRFARRANLVGVQRKRRSATVSAARYHQHHHAPVLDHRGRAIRERMSV
jgi:hypothetical protein